MRFNTRSILAMTILAVFFTFFIAGTIASNSGSSGDASLSIEDNADSTERYSRCDGFCSQKDKPSSSLWNVYFYANLTNSSGASINSSDGNGNCTIRFNETGTWTSQEDMEYNTSSSLWQYNYSFTYKGILNFSVNCTSDFGNISLFDDITITNTEPYIIKTAAGYVDFDGDGVKDTLQCTEDTLCQYNFTSNVSEDDLNDILTFNYTSTSNTTLTNFTLDSSTGILNINITHDNNTGIRTIELNVKDTESTTKSAILETNITAVNDAPIFVNLENRTFNMSELFEYSINITDEENNIPFSLNITFLNCSTAEWSDRNSTSCELFNTSHYAFNGTSGILNISFIPVRNDVGYYSINFSVTDNSSLGNKTSSQVVNFTVMHINTPPYFTYVCDNERTATEDSEFTCWINVSDIDETSNLTFTANYTWFTFNGTSNSTTLIVNLSTGYNASALVNFTPTDTEVGNWSINVSVKDTDGGIGPSKANSTLFWFFIDNIEDVLSLEEISNQTVYENITIYVNATDNDLLVPDKNEKNEVITFKSNVSWVEISDYSVSGNITTATINIDFDTAQAIGGDADYRVMINVTDTGGNYAERNFTISIRGDNPASWNSSKQYEFGVYEGNETYLNVSTYVSDPDSDALTFSFKSSNSFSNFALTSGGIINFTPTDIDVGYHNVTINASDGKLDSLMSFNFTVYNVNEIPYIEKPIESGSVINASVDSYSNINCSEDNLTTIFLWIQDEDFRIPSGQESFYNENLTINVTIEGRNDSLFRFVLDQSFSNPSNNRTKFNTTFTPKKEDVGHYNITINITDSGGYSDILYLNLTVSSISHNPILMNLTNQTTTVNTNFYYRINASDSEDGSSTTAGNTNFTFTYNFTTGTSIFNSTIFNSTSGEINLTPSSGQGGAYHINITVNDSSGTKDSKDFWMFVYDSPNITFPASDYEFTLTENSTFNLTFRANHSVQTTLNYRIYIQNPDNEDILRYNLTYYGNDTNLTWELSTNFTDETYGRARNITLAVINPDYPDLNTSTSWNIEINHTNAPVVFSGHIGDKQASYDSYISINLTTYFSDVDFSDSSYNQTVNFSIVSNASPSYISSIISNWSLTLTSSIVVKEVLYINATDVNETNYTLTSAPSNVFEVEFTEPSSTTTTPSPSSGGGGSTTPVSLKILLPDPVSAYKKEMITVPITLSNSGGSNLYEIDLTASVAKDNITRKDITVSFDKNYFDSLLTGKKKNSTLTINLDTEEPGLYEITINASVGSPKYQDWGKLYLTVRDENKTELLEKLLFTEEFIAENPECIEIKELVKEAWKYYESGNYGDALKKSNEAIEACKYAIQQPGLPRTKESNRNDLYKYLSLTAMIMVIGIIIYYLYERGKMKKFR